MLIIYETHRLVQILYSILGSQTVSLETCGSRFVIDNQFVSVYGVRGMRVRSGNNPGTPNSAWHQVYSHSAILFQMGLSCNVKLFSLISVMDDVRCYIDYMMK